MASSVSIPAQFNGPPGTGHGGYSCGRFAAFVPLRAAEGVGAASVASVAAVEVTLRRPPPVETEIDVVSGHDQIREVRFEHDGALVAEARGTQLDIDALAIPRPPTMDEALRAEQRSAFRRRHVDHPFPTCFGCGPLRTPEDGLRQWPGLLDDERAAASVWEPPSWTADGRAVRPEMVWAALDCPGALGAMEQLGITLGDEPWVLGRMTAAQLQPVPLGDRYIILGWLRSRSGRKRAVASALLSAGGVLLAAAEAVWVTLPGPG